MDIWKLTVDTLGFLQLHYLMQKFLLSFPESKHEHPNVANRCDQLSTVQGALSLVPKLLT